MGLCGSDADEGINIGKKALRALLEGQHSTTKDSDAIFHQGSTYCHGDIRTLIGVVRWYPAQQEMPEHGYWPAKSYEYDVIKMGAPYVQKVPRARRAGTFLNIILVLNNCSQDY